MPNPPPSIGQKTAGVPAVREFDARPSAAARGYDRKWRKLVERHLAAEPLCRDCAGRGRAEAATLVDHIVPVKGREDPKFWDWTNHQSLCRRCHARKTQKDKAAGLTRNWPQEAQKAQEQSEI